MSNDDYEGKLDGVRVLIVDDDRDILESFEAALASEGAETFTAGDGNTAITRCNEHKPDVVVLDAVWPNPTRGAATLSFALAAPTDVTVTLVDGLGRTVVEAQRGALGAGAQTVALDASGLVPGVYFAAVTVGGGTTPESRRVLPLTVAR